MMLCNCPICGKPHDDGAMFKHMFICMECIDNLSTEEIETRLFLGECRGVGQSPAENLSEVKD